MRPLRIHATNLSGMGSRRLAEALLPSLIEQAEGPVELFVAPGDSLARFAQDRGHRATPVPRRLPNAISRLVEVTAGASRFRGEGDMLVLGDLPLAGVADQSVLVHNPFLIDGSEPGSAMARAKFKVARAIFARNESSARRFIVQTQSMRDGLKSTYGIADERIAVIAQPPPEAIRQLRASAPGREGADAPERLSLFYPSRCYPHKRHDRLTHSLLDSLSETVAKIVLTVAPDIMPGGPHPLLDLIGEVDIERVAREYSSADALLFLSDAESYGLPLLEALWLDRPVVCPDLPYARDILGDNPFFFAPGSPDSLRSAIERLHTQLAQGWRADWSQRRGYFPKDWPEVSARFLEQVRP